MELSHSAKNLFRFLDREDEEDYNLTEIGASSECVVAEGYAKNLIIAERVALYLRKTSQQQRKGAIIYFVKLFSEFKAEAAFQEYFEEVRQELTLLILVPQNVKWVKIQLAKIVELTATTLKFCEILKSEEPDSKDYTSVIAEIIGEGLEYNLGLVINLLSFLFGKNCKLAQQYFEKLFEAYPDSTQLKGFLIDYQSSFKVAA